MASSAPRGVRCPDGTGHVGQVSAANVASAGCPAIGERTPCRLRATVDTNSNSAANATPPTAIAAETIAARRKSELVSIGIAIAVSIDTEANHTH